LVQQLLQTGKRLAQFTRTGVWRIRAMGDGCQASGSLLRLKRNAVPQAMLRAVQALIFSRKHLSLLDLIEAFALALPGGLYDISSLDRYLSAVLSRPV